MYLLCADQHLVILLYIYNYRKRCRRDVVSRAEVYRLCTSTTHKNAENAIQNTKSVTTILRPICSTAIRLFAFDKGNDAGQGFYSRSSGRLRGVSIAGLSAFKPGVRLRLLRTRPPFLAPAVDAFPWARSGSWVLTGA